MYVEQNQNNVAKIKANQFWRDRGERPQLILSALKSGTKTTSELIDVAGSHRFSVDIDLLRKQGYKIKTTKHPSGATYELTGYTPQYEVIPGMQDAYYASSHWRYIREQRLLFDGNRCCLCGKGGKGLHVHHWEYRLFSEELEDLSTYCEKCHQYIHQRCRGAGFPRFVSAEVYQQLQIVMMSAN